MTPEEIYQANLDAVTDALFGADHDTVLAHLALPHLLQTLDARTWLRTEAEMVQSVTDFVAALERIGANGLLRLCTAARFVTEARIEGAHLSRMLKDGQPLGNAYSVHMVLEHLGGRWKVTESRTSASNRKTPVISDAMLAKAMHRPR